jgi:hypothetical protein
MPAKSMFYSRINNAANLIKDVQNEDNSFYACIGKSDAYSDTATDFTDDNLYPELVNGATRSQSYEAQVRQNFLAMKKLTSSYITHAIRRYDWISGQSYVQWDSTDPDIFTKRFYIMTDENRVYKCIKKGAGASTVKPTHNDTTPTTEADGYMWRFMYTVSSVQVTRFLNNVYIPVKTVPESGLSTDDDIQYANQLESLNIAGKIYTIKVVNGGTGYSSATVAITGNGTGATATAVLTDGVVTAINITNSGSNYSVAQVAITGNGTGATAVPILSPFGGHGYDPVTELGGEFVMASFTLVGDEEGTFIINDDFRQVSLIKNPYNFGTTTIATAERIEAVRTMRLSSVTNGSQFIASNIGSVIQSSSDATIKAFVVSYDQGNGDLKYTQNDKTGYKNFVQGSTITSNTGASGTIATLAQATPDVNIHSGQLLVVDNIQAVNRTTAGQESLTFIIQH